MRKPLCAAIPAMLGAMSSRGSQRLMAMLIGLSACADASFGFQERSLGEVGDRPAGLPNALQVPGLDVQLPQPGLGAGAGTEIRVPGVGSVGTLPRLDFGLELLYGANEAAGRFDDRSQPSDVQIRATIKHRF
jgi:hypothetical protein